jgi:hypothetical protein
MRAALVVLSVVSFLSTLPAAADTAADVYAAMGIKAVNVMNSSVVESRVLPGDAKEVVAVVTFLTGKKDEAAALDVRLEIYRRERDTLVSIFGKDVGSENGGYVGRGELSLLDLDGDGVNEIGLYYDNLKNRLVTERTLEVIVYDDSAYRVAWSGAVEYDATKAVRDVPQDRRDRYLRKLDFANTRRTKGLTLFMTKIMISVAGERLPQPRQMQETFPLRGQVSH